MKRGRDAAASTADSAYSHKSLAGLRTSLRGEFASLGSSMIALCLLPRKERFSTVKQSKFSGPIRSGARRGTNSAVKVSFQAVGKRRVPFWGAIYSANLVGGSQGGLGGRGFGG